MSGSQSQPQPLVDETVPASAVRRLKKRKYEPSEANHYLSKLETAYSRLASVKLPVCGPICGVPGLGCQPEGCAAAEKHAAEVYGIRLARQKNEMLPFMGKNGCTVAPYLRPNCTRHVCSEHLADETFAYHYRVCTETIDAVAANLGHTVRLNPLVSVVLADGFCAGPPKAGCGGSIPPEDAESQDGSSPLCGP